MEGRVGLEWGSIRKKQEGSRGVGGQITISRSQCGGRIQSPGQQGGKTVRAAMQRDRGKVPAQRQKGEYIL